MVNQCLLLWLLAATFGVMQTSIAALVLLVAIGLSLAGVVRLASSLPLPRGQAIACELAVFVPVANLLAMAWLGTRAGTVLSAHGYRVGLLVATRRSEA